MKTFLLSVAAVVAIAAWIAPRSSESARVSGGRAPILVELFTSEACSSCPPADRFLEKLDQQPIAGAEVIVLSEHVDYWNHSGWKDPYSSSSFSARQSAYARRFGLDDVYTPQMVVDGASQFVGSDSGLAAKAFQRTLDAPKIPVRLSLVSLDGPGVLHARVETGSFDASFAGQPVDVFLALALSRASTQVSTGENAGHRLTHVSVAKSLEKVGALQQGHSFSQDVQVKLEPGGDFHNLRLIAFIQEARQGRVLGAAEVPISAK